MRTQVTLKTLAQELNLSTSTVSRALADQWDVNPQTKELVLALALKLDYRPNIMAVKLKNCHKNKRNNEKTAKVTLKDIAEQLNLAPSTVSRALANKEDVSKKTRETVQSLAKKLHYRPNPIAAALKQYSGRYA